MKTKIVNIKINIVSSLMIALLITISSIANNAYSQTWSAVGSGGMSDWVYASTVYNGDLIVGGKFTSAGGINANHIARWDGTSWHSLGLGVNGKVNDMIVFNGELIVGGEFTEAGGVPMLFISKWNGTQWLTDLGDMGSIVTSFAIYNNKLIVGGYFTEADGVPVNYITQYTNNGWAPIGSGVVGTQGQVMDLEVYNNELIAGGFFTSAGGVPANHIAKWNGTTWSALGSGISNIVYTFTNYKGKLIAGGLFLSAGGVPANHIASWNGSSWSALGGGMSGTFYQYVFALKEYNGNLIAGGYFTHSDGIQTNGIAKWNDTSWSAMGCGLFYPGNVYGSHTFCIYDNELFVGGLFYNAGCVSAGHLASYYEYPVNVTLSVTGTNTNCLTNNTGTINLSAVGGTPPYVYLWSNGTTTQDISGLAKGTYTVTVTDATSATAVISYTVGANALPAPAKPALITGTTKVCIGSNYTFTASTVANAGSYNWTVPANSNIISGQGTTVVQVIFNTGYTSGNVAVTASNCTGTSAARTFNTSLLAKPAVPGVITGIAAVCPGSYTYSISAVSNATSYNWLAPANSSIISGQGSTLITVLYNGSFLSGNISVNASNCSGSSVAKTLAVTKTPKAPVAISGPIYNICNTTTGISYTIAPVAGATSYTWIVTGGSIVSGQGTTAITVDFPASFTSATVKVAANTSCATGVLKTLKVYQAPNKPLVITGNTLVCPGLNYTYTTAAVANVTSYTWTVPTGWTIVSGQGNNTITVTAGAAGSIKVAPGNACKTGASRTLAVNTNVNCRTADPVIANEYNSITDVKLFPNPTENFSTIIFNAENEMAYNMEVTNTLGQVIMQQNGTTAIGINSISINLSNNQGNLFFVNLSYGNNRLQRLKLVKQ